MAQPVTSDDIEILFGRELTDSETDMADLFIGFAEGEIESYLNRPIMQRVFSEVIFPDGNGVAYFKQTPVTNILTLSVNGSVVPATYLTHSPYGLENVFEQILVIRPYGIYEIPYDFIYGATIEVTYQAGLDYPPEIRSLVAQAVTSKMRVELARQALETSTGSGGGGGIGIKRIKADDFETEYFNSATTSNNAAISVMTMFPSEADLRIVRGLKRPGIW